MSKFAIAANTLGRARLAQEKPVDLSKIRPVKGKKDADKKEDKKESTSADDGFRGTRFDIRGGAIVYAPQEWEAKGISPSSHDDFNFWGLGITAQLDWMPIKSGIFNMGIGVRTGLEGWIDATDIGDDVGTTWSTQGAWPIAFHLTFGLDLGESDSDNKHLLRISPYFGSRHYFGDNLPDAYPVKGIESKMFTENWSAGADITFNITENFWVGARLGVQYLSDTQNIGDSAVLMQYGSSEYSFEGGLMFGGCIAT